MSLLPPSVRLSFTGQRQDTVSGLYDFSAREYSIQGRFSSPDPAGLAAVDPSNPQSWNRYAYVLNNPLALTDPDGLDPCQGANNFTFSQAANGTGIFTQDDCIANGGSWGDNFLNGGGGNTPSGNGPTFGADNTPGCVPVQTDPLGNAPPSLNCNTDGSSGPGSIASTNSSGNTRGGSSQTQKVQLPPAAQACVAQAKQQVQNQLQVFSGYAGTKILGRALIGAGLGAMRGFYKAAQTDSPWIIASSATVGAAIGVGSNIFSDMLSIRKIQNSFMDKFVACVQNTSAPKPPE